MLTLDNAPNRLLWLDAGQRAISRAAVQTPASNLGFLEQAAPVGISYGPSASLLVGGWVYINDEVMATDGAFIARHNASQDQRSFNLRSNRDNQRITFQVSSLGGSGGTVAISAWNVHEHFNEALPFGAWLFVLAGWDAANQLLRMRCGTPEVAFDAEDPSAFAGPIHEPAAPLTLGAIRHNDISTWRHSGRLDEFFLGSPPDLSEQAFDDLFAALYNDGDGRSYPTLTVQEKTDLGLISWWPLNERGAYPLTRRDLHGANDLSQTDPQGISVVSGHVSGPAINLSPVQEWSSRLESPAIAYLATAISNQPTYRVDPDRISFDGTNDRLSHGDGPVIANRSTFTHLLRVQPTAVPGVLYCEEDATGDVQYRVALTADGDVEVSYRASGDAQTTTVTSTESVATGEDVVIAVRRDDDQLSIYLDGEPAGSGTISSGTDLTGATSRLGGPVASGDHFHGQIYDHWAAETAFSDSEIAELSGSEPEEPEPDPLEPGTLNPPTAITHEGATLSWSAATGGVGTITDQLQRSADAGASWSDVPGATASPAVVTDQDPETTCLYRVLYSDGTETVQSNTRSVTTLAEPGDPGEPGNGGDNVDLTEVLDKLDQILSRLDTIESLIAQAASTAEHTARGGSADTIQLSEDDSPIPGVYARIEIIGGTGRGQVRRITHYTGGADKIATVHEPWDVEPDSTSRYAAYGHSVPMAEVYPDAGGLTPEAILQAIEARLFRQELDLTYSQDGKTVLSGAIVTRDRAGNEVIRSPLIVEEGRIIGMTIGGD